MWVLPYAFSSKLMGAMRSQIQESAQLEACHRREQRTKDQRGAGAVTLRGGARVLKPHRSANTEASCRAALCSHPKTGLFSWDLGFYTFKRGLSG